MQSCCSLHWPSKYSLNMLAGFCKARPCATVPAHHTMRRRRPTSTPIQWVPQGPRSSTNPSASATPCVRVFHRATSVAPVCFNAINYLPSMNGVGLSRPMHVNPWLCLMQSQTMLKYRSMHASLQSHCGPGCSALRRLRCLPMMCWHALSYR